MSAPVNPRWIIGRTIVGIEYESAPARDNDGGKERYHPDTRFVLDNGAQILFHGEESDFGEYGVAMTYIKPRNKP